LTASIGIIVLPFTATTAAFAVGPTIKVKDTDSNVILKNKVKE